jgi:starvation-inducible DNA-binding protein
MNGSAHHELPHGFTAAAVGAISSILSRQLADHVVLSIKLRHAHWNVGGAQFSALHALFAALYRSADEQIDELAERIRSLSAAVDASLQAFLHETRLSEFTAAVSDPGVLLSNLAIDYEQLSRRLRSDAELLQNEFADLVGAELLIRCSAAHDKAAWQLRSHLARH